MNNSKYNKWLFSIFKKNCKNFIINNNEIIITVSKEILVPTITFLKKHTNCQYSILSDLGCVDFFTKKNRFNLVYQILSTKFSHRITVKANCDINVDTLVTIYPGINWYEREVFDIFGVFFKGHPDLRRILTDYGFEGYPLRKDFPLTGFTEVRYDFEKKRVICEYIEISQEFRPFYYVFPKKIEINNYQIN